MSASLSKRPEADAGGCSTGRGPDAKAEFHRRLVALGLMTRLPDHAADFEDPDDQLVELPGEPLSETIIRERR